MNSLPQSDNISSGKPKSVKTLIRQRTTSAAVCVLSGKASGKCLAKSMTVKMNLFPEPVQGVNGPTISTAILEKMLPITGRLTKGALWCKAPFRPLLYHPSVNLSWKTIRELLQLHHFFQTSDIRGRFFALDPTIERKCETKCKIGICFIPEFIESSKSLPMKFRNALVS